MRKLLVIMLGLFAVTIVAGCSSNNSLAKGLEFKSDNEVFAFSAVSGAGLMNSDSSNQRRSSKRYTDDKDEFELEKFIPIIENFLYGDEGIKIEVVESDLEEYQVLEKVTINTIDKNTSYLFYYNETKELDDDSDDDDDEQEYILEGILIMDEVTYDIVGKKEIENDEEEYEIITKIDDKNYIKVEYGYENEDDELERYFKHTKYEDGKKVFETKMEVEIEDNEKEIELEIKENGITSKYQFELENDMIEAKYEIKTSTSTEKGKAVIKVIVNEDGTKTYEIIKQKMETNGDDD